MDSNEQGRKIKVPNLTCLLLRDPEDLGCVLGDLILSGPLYFETEVGEELKAAEVHVGSCIQAQLLPRQLLEAEKRRLPNACGRAQAGWRSETRKDAGNSRGNTLPSSLR